MKTSKPFRSATRRALQKCLWAISDDYHVFPNASMSADAAKRGFPSYHDQQLYIDSASKEELRMQLELLVWLYFYDEDGESSDGVLRITVANHFSRLGILLPTIEELPAGLWDSDYRDAVVDSWSIERVTSLSSKPKQKGFAEPLYTIDWADGTSTQIVEKTPTKKSGTDKVTCFLPSTVYSLK